MESPVHVVSAGWLKEQLQLGKQDIKIVDGTWHRPVWKRDAEAEYVEHHIPGAVRFNTDEIADKSASLPQTPPSPEQFNETMSQLGICNEDHVIIYDNNSKYGMYSSARVWYMFKLYGHERVSILDGGLPKWLAEGGPVQSGPNDTNFKPVEYKRNYQDGLHCTFEQVLKQHNASPSTIIDARSSGRFNGTEPEPDPEIHSGHIVGSKNLFWQEFLDKNSKTLKSPEELQKVFTDNNVNLDVLNIATCGSGITACWITLAAQIINKDIPVYTGSWLEWYGKGPDRTKVLGIKG